jgi:hypothetical protein
MSRKNHSCSEAVVILSESAVCDTDLRSLTGGGYLSERPKAVKSVKNIFYHFVFSAFFTFRLDSSSTPVRRSGIEGQQKAQLEKNKIGRERERPHFFGFPPPKKFVGSLPPLGTQAACLGYCVYAIEQQVVCARFNNMYM